MRKREGQQNAPRFSQARFDQLNTNKMQNRLFDLIVHSHLTIRTQILIRHGLREKNFASIFKRAEIVEIARASYWPM